MADGGVVLLLAAGLSAGAFAFQETLGELYDFAQDRTERVNQYANPQFMTVRNTLSQSLAVWKQRYSH